MTKYKPIEFNVFPPKTLTDNILITLYAASKISRRLIDGTRGFTCSNPNCKQETLLNERIFWIPPRCIACGEEFDWEGILIETKKICPVCQQIYSDNANFCAFHPIKEKIQLIPFERRINK